MNNKQLTAGYYSDSLAPSMFLQANIKKPSSSPLRFSDEVRNKWIVRRDQCGDEYIVLTGKKALGYGGHDHIYFISARRVGLWVTSKQVRQKIKSLQHKVPDLAVEQLGDDEAVLSAPLDHLELLCRAAKARRRRQLSETRKQHLRRISPFLRGKKPLIKLGANASQIAERGDKGIPGRKNVNKPKLMSKPPNQKIIE